MRPARMVVLTVWLLAGAAPLGAAPSSRVERAGTVGLLFGGGYGLVTGESRYGSEFEAGWGLDLQLKYVLGPHWSLGLGFQSQMYESTTEAFNQGLSKLQMTLIRGDVYYYRDRNQDASQYLVFGLGLDRPEVHYQSENILFPGESVEFSLGLGAEIFIGESWGLDLGGRAIAYLSDGYSPEEEAEGPLEYTDTLSLAFRGQASIFFYILR